MDTVLELIKEFQAGLSSDLRDAGHSEAATALLGDMTSLFAFPDDDEADEASVLDAVEENLTRTRGIIRKQVLQAAQGTAATPRQDASLQNTVGGTEDGFYAWESPDTMMRLSTECNRLADAYENLLQLHTQAMQRIQELSDLEAMHAQAQQAIAEAAPQLITKDGFVRMKRRALPKLAQQSESATNTPRRGKAASSAAGETSPISKATGASADAEKNRDAAAEAVEGLQGTAAGRRQVVDLGPSIDLAEGPNGLDDTKVRQTTNEATGPSLTSEKHGPERGRPQSKQKPDALGTPSNRSSLAKAFDAYSDAASNDLREIPDLKIGLLLARYIMRCRANAMLDELAAEPVPRRAASIRARIEAWDSRQGQVWKAKAVQLNLIEEQLLLYQTATPRVSMSTAPRKAVPSKRRNQPGADQGAGKGATSGGSADNSVQSSFRLWRSTFLPPSTVASSATTAAEGGSSVVTPKFVAMAVRRIHEGGNEPIEKGYSGQIRHNQRPDSEGSHGTATQPLPPIQ